MSDHITALIRTAVPFLAAAALVTIFDLLSNFDRATATTVIGIIYYEVIRVAEDKGIRWAGYLLGVPKSPIYTLDTDSIARLTSSGDYDGF